MVPPPRQFMLTILEIGWLFEGCRCMATLNQCAIKIEMIGSLLILLVFQRSPISLINQAMIKSTRWQLHSKKLATIFLIPPISDRRIILINLPTEENGTFQNSLALCRLNEVVLAESRFQILFERWCISLSPKPV